MRETFLSLVSVAILTVAFWIRVSILVHANLIRLFGPTTKTQFSPNLAIEEEEKDHPPIS